MLASCSATCTSSFHPIALDRTDDETATLKLAGGTVPADKDFELIWRPKAAAVPQTALFHETVNGQDYLLAMVTPPTLDSASKLLPRELIFVIDNSGSMAGTSIVQAKQSLLYRARPFARRRQIQRGPLRRHHGDLFDRARSTPVPENLAIAKNFVSRLDAEGGTEMLPALKAALNDANPQDTSRLRQVVFLTDGSVGNEAQLFEEIANHAWPLAPIHGRHRLGARTATSCGARPSSAAARFTEIGAEDQVLDPHERAVRQAREAGDAGLKAEWPQGTRREVWPDPLPTSMPASLSCSPPRSSR